MLEALGGDEHVSSDNLLGLDEWPVCRAGRRHELASRFELSAHVQDTVLELLLPGVEGGKHLLHLRWGGLLPPGYAPLEEQVFRHVSPMGHVPARLAATLNQRERP